MPTRNKPAGETQANGVVDLRAWLVATAEMVGAVNVDAPIEGLLTKVSQKARQLLHLDMCAVMLADDAGRQLLVRGSDGLSPEYINRINGDHPLLVSSNRSDRRSPSVQAYLTGRTITIPDVQAAEDFEPWRDLALKEGYGALIAAPLQDGERIAGVLVGYSLSSRDFEPVHSELLNLLADHAGIALQTARLRAAGQSMIDQLNEANAELRLQRHTLEVSEDQHRRLMQVMANDVGVSGVVTMLAELLEASVALEDVHGNVLASAALGTYIAPPSGRDREQPAVREAFAVLAKDRSGSVQLPAMTDGAIQFWIAPVTLGGEIAAYLWVGIPSASLDAVSRRGIERFALAVALEIAKQRTGMEVQLGLSRDLLSDLLSEVRITQRTALLERAAAMGHDLTQPHQVIVASPDPAAGSSTDPTHQLARLAHTAHAALRRMGLSTIVGTTDHELVILLPVGSGEEHDKQATASGAAESIQADLRNASRPHTASFVLGGRAGDLGDIADHYRSAKGALRLMPRHQPGAIIDLSNLGVYALLLAQTDTALLQRFANSLISPLKDRDARKQSDLIETLRCWLECNCSTSATAERLVVHTNTVIYRLRIIEELLGQSLRNQAFLLDVRLALMVAEVESARSGR